MNKKTKKNRIKCSKRLYKTNYCKKNKKKSILRRKIKSIRIMRLRYFKEIKLKIKGEKN